MGPIHEIVAQVNFLSLERADVFKTSNIMTQQEEHKLHPVWKKTPKHNKKTVKSVIIHNETRPYS